MKVRRKGPGRFELVGGLDRRAQRRHVLWHRCRSCSERNYAHTNTRTQVPCTSHRIAGLCER